MRRTMVEQAIGAILLMTLTASTVGAQQATSESKARNHDRFVAGSMASCLEACSAGDPPFEERTSTANECEESCQCIGEQLAARITGDDLWRTFLAEQAGASRSEAMSPLVPKIAMGYKACGFPLR